MTNKLVVVINNLKVPKIKKILLYEMEFLYQITADSRKPWLGGYRHQTPVLSVLCTQLKLLNPTPTPPKKTPGYAIGSNSKWGLTTMQQLQLLCIQEQAV